jgi:glycosyltransferase EpsE
MVYSQHAPLISVIMGIYNCAELLPGCFQSLLDQTLTDWELIMCDDGSTDDTAAVAQQLADEYPRKATVLRNDCNHGLAYSLNHCLSVARGTFLARQDADDFSLPERFEKQVAFLRAHPEYGWVSSATMVFNEEGEDIGIRTNKAEPVATDVATRTVFTHAPTIFRAEVLGAVEGYTVAYYTRRTEDWDLWTRLFAAGYHGYNLQEPLYRVREDRQAYQRKKRHSSLLDMITFFHGYRRLKLPLYYYPLALKPVLMNLLPAKLRKRIQEVRLKSSNHSMG